MTDYMYCVRGFGGDWIGFCLSWVSARIDILVLLCFGDTLDLDLGEMSWFSRKKQNMYQTNKYQMFQVFSIVYTYIYYPPIWKNVIEGYMEVNENPILNILL